MSRFKTIFKDSAKEFKNIRCITIAAMLGAMAVVLSQFTIVISDFLKISFSFLPNRIVYYLFGPFVGMLYGAAMDILTFIVKPTGPYHPGFTINAAISGLIFGLILYKKPLSLSRIFVASTIKMIIVNIILNSYWISTITGKAFMAIMPVRITKNILLLPVEAVSLFLVITAVKLTGVFKVLSTNNNK